MNESDIILYTNPQGHVRVEVYFEEETFWLSQKRMSELFGKDVRTINEHLKNIFESGELNPDPTIRKFRIVQMDGNREVSLQIDFYNLDAFLQFNEYDVLKDAGKVSHKVAQNLAQKTFDQYRIIHDRNYESDFDKEIKELKKNKPKE